MKKFLKSRIFVAILTAIICICGTVYAENLIDASKIKYRETTLDNALDQLYSKVGNYKVTKLVYENNSRTDGWNLNINISNKYSDYKNITIDNMIIQLNDVLLCDGVSEPKVNTLTYSYNNATGILNIKSQYFLFTVSSTDVTVLIYK